MDPREMGRWLREEDEDALEGLWREADRVRRERVGEAVHLRGLIELSNHCVRHCAYCGIRGPNRDVTRYRMTEGEILECVRQAVEFGYGTVVMQSGEDYGISGDWLAGVIGRIKEETPLAVTLSLGARPEADLKAWREAGADRYLLRFETSDPELYRTIHPPGPSGAPDRVAVLGTLKRLGYEAGSGVMVGIPGQGYASLVRDIGLFHSLDLDMVGVGPYLPHPATPLASGGMAPRISPDEQVPNSEGMTCKVLALTRLACPDINIPSTTALAAISPGGGRELGLQRGANVVMPNLTPPAYRAHYEIYPAKGATEANSRDFHDALMGRLRALGRTAGKGPGGRS